MIIATIISFFIIEPLIYIFIIIYLLVFTTLLPTPYTSISKDIFLISILGSTYFK